MSPNYTESQQKEIAAQAALKYVISNSVIGLGSGSTAEKFINLLGTAVKEGHLENIKVVSSSKKSAALAEALHLTVFEPEAVTDIDLNVDGTDVVKIRGVKCGILSLAKKQAYYEIKATAI